MDEEQDIDLNVSFKSSDYSDEDLSGNKNEEESFNINMLREEQLKVSFDESIEIDELNIEATEPKQAASSSRNKYIAKHLQQFVHHNLKFNSSYKSMESMARVLNSTPNTSIKVPSTIYRLKKCIPSKIEYKFNIKCSGCQNFIVSDKNETICTLCDLPIKTAQHDYFVTISLEQQLKMTIEKYFEQIIAYSTGIAETDGTADLHNSKMFLDAKKKYPSINILPLIINTDGVKVHKKSTDSLWLIQICQAFLPPKYRFVHTNVLMVAAHFGQHKPNIPDFFSPFLKSYAKWAQFLLF